MMPIKGQTSTLAHLYKLTNNNTSFTYFICNKYVIHYTAVCELLQQCQRCRDIRARRSLASALTKQVAPLAINR